jgi:Bacterial Ig-like domain (group 3)/RTX calcium-binding nonapeptide repeat (4 copies)
MRADGKAVPRRLGVVRRAARSVPRRLSVPLLVGASVLVVPVGAGAQSSTSVAPASAPAATITVTPDVWLSSYDPATDSPASGARCGHRDPVHAPNPCVPGVAADGSAREGWESQQFWGWSDAIQDRVGFGINSGSSVGVALGEIFTLADHIHWNQPIVGDFPTSIGVHGAVTVDPPGGAPFVIPLQRPDAPVYADAWQGFYLDYLETDNDFPCSHPEIQLSDVPCDDPVWLADHVVGSSRRGTVVREVDAHGVRWRLEILGWRDAEGTIRTTRASVEGTSVVQQIVARITAVSSTATTSSLAADRATSTLGEAVTLTATVAPAPGTGGTVAFLDNGTAMAGCEAQPVDVSTGVATCTTSALPVGDHQLSSVYGGSIGFVESTSSPLAHTVSTASGGGETTLYPCDPETRTIAGTPGNDRITGTPGPDVIFGLGGNDVIFGLGGNDVICGGEGKDDLRGGDGRDKVHGGEGDDRVNGGPGVDSCWGWTGTDTYAACEVFPSGR